MDDGPAGFEWIDGSDWEQSVVSFIRWSRGHAECVLGVCNLNFTPVPRDAYRVSVPRPGYRELVNTDAALYGGSNLGNAGGAWAEPVPWQGWPHAIVLTLPPLSPLVLKATAR